MKPTKHQILTNKLLNGTPAMGSIKINIMATAAGVIKQGSNGPVPGKGIWNASVCRPGSLDCVYTDTYGAFLIPANYIPGETLKANAGHYDAKNFVPTWNASLGAYYAVVELTYNPPPPSSSSCFTGDTQVLMADGSSRRISEVRVGDLVLGAQHKVNRVIDIERPVLGNRQLFAFNGEKHFITKEHPIMTANGWASISPRATQEENSRMSVLKLETGMSVIRYARASQMALHGIAESLMDTPMQMNEETLTRIEARTDRWDLPLFNLILDGSHTYFANRYLVHNKGGH
ncbi:Hint domain-containing homing endonuclease [Robiginitalea sp. M366]|uniref:Hint domain-containing protein n=1 Tax=Robiginitalea aestuariiviva TaxID=3036903 RepID=UPI00240DF38B|nr:Hint domain-containing protein [Robiginitalea aestuariiviva]MDG1573274.1 Hint domain-containing homing endonuclease [Robiginitalea aestuariiviva]